MTEWREIAERYSLPLFEEALKGCLQRADFFPLPKALEDECKRLYRQSKAFDDAEMIAYRQRIKTHPEEFVKVGDLFREAIANVKRRKGQAA